MRGENKKIKSTLHLSKKKGEEKRKKEGRKEEEEEERESNNNLPRFSSCLRIF
jgi:hypothetical protein